MCRPNRITIESKPCHVIQSKTVILTPRVDHDHFSQSVFPFPCFLQECPALLPSVHCSPILHPHSPTPPTTQGHLLQLKSTTDKNLKQKQQLVFQYQSGLFWDFMLSSPRFPSLHILVWACQHTKEATSHFWAEMGLESSQQMSALSPPRNPSSIF